MPQTHRPKAVRSTARRRAWLGTILGGLGVLATCLVIRYLWNADSANADPPARAANSARATRPATPNTRPAKTTTSDRPSSPQIVATVNGRPITRDVLSRECLRHYGKEVLESLVNKVLIARECKRRNVTVTREDVDAEIDRMAHRFGLPQDQWLRMLESERGIKPAQYASDIIWPTLALRRLAGSRLKVTPEELRKAYETKYGPAVRVRLISCKDLTKAKRVHAAAKANPDDFGDLAKNESEDASAAFKGLTEPIRMHGSYQQIEQAAFNISDGEVSEVIPAGGQYVILRRESLIPGAKSVSYERVAPRLEEIIRDGKLRSAAKDMFRQLQEHAKVVNVLNDPVWGRKLPGVAALIDGQKVLVAQLAEECIQRHGEEVLEGTINRQLIEQACQKRRITITEADLDREILRAASVSVPLKADGSPDVDAWLKLATEKQGISVDVYRRDAVWPSVALKKLVGDNVKVTEEDLRKAYEANYGPKVRCLAIVMDNLRRAQDVWTKARNNCTAEFFGDLAAAYSNEPGSRALRGEVPPIRKHGGQPLLEKEAFLLKPGELSGIIEVEDQYIILYCLGYTKPTGVSPDQVRNEMYRHIFEKKRRLAMAEHFQRLQETATIDNYLAGTSHSPSKAAGPQPLRQAAPRR